MTEQYDPDKVNEQVFGDAQGPPPQSAPQSAPTREAQPLSQDDAIVLANTKDEFDRSPIPDSWYSAVIEKAEFGFTGPNAKKPNSPKINFTFKITGPTQVGRFVWFNIAPRSGDFGAIMLNKLMARAMKQDAKGEYHALINSIDAKAKFDEKAFCDQGIAIGAEAKIKVGIGTPYKKTTGADAGTMVTPNAIKDIAPPASGKKFME